MWATRDVETACDNTSGHFCVGVCQVNQDRLGLRERSLGITSTTSSPGGRSKGLYIISSLVSTAASFAVSPESISTGSMMSSSTVADAALDGGGVTSVPAALEGSTPSWAAGRRLVGAAPTPVRFALRHSSSTTQHSRHHRVSVESAWKGRSIAANMAVRCCSSAVSPSLHYDKQPVPPLAKLKLNQDQISLGPIKMVCNSFQQGCTSPAHSSLGHWPWTRRPSNTKKASRRVRGGTDLTPRSWIQLMQYHQVEPSFKAPTENHHT